jgi:hypothetical protein
MHLTASHVCRSLVTLRLGSDETYRYDYLSNIVESVCINDEPYLMHSFGIENFCSLIREQEKALLSEGRISFLTEESPF